ncbi:AraC family transcriptional regulator [Tropicimonas marinistellae]|uniref:AraC family transcriptional regulator n=1 Tax=Tropicimonas marinistellae TaxID=1739787 RepID=UPI000836934B|nr:AraC family transcriptional regulator [Tropicimonas marinistellae]
MANHYEKRILRVLEHMHTNPAGDLSLDALAEVAAMSRFHWHRVFRTMTGETCAQAVRRIRMHRAACWLVQTDWPIPEVARRCGYPGLTSFSRTFRAAFGVPPGQFRQNGSLRLPPVPRKSGDPIMFDIDVTTHPAQRLAAIAHTGPYVEIGRAFETLSALCTSRNLWPQVRALLGIYYHDPDSTPAEELRSHAAVALAPGTEIGDVFEELVTEAGKVAVLRFKGPYSGLKPAYDYLYGTWLPQSGEEPRNAPCYEIYLNTPQDTAPEDLVTEICLPLK